MAQTLREHLETRWAALKKERSSWWSHWRDLNEHVLPRRGRFVVSDYNKGAKRNTKILDNTAVLANRTLASGLMAGITSPARPWFRLGLNDTDLMEFGPAKQWLHDVESILRDIFSRSNMYNVLHSNYGELGAFGTGPIIVDEDTQDVIRGFQCTVGSYALGTDHRGQVTTMYRELPMTVNQAVGMFGLSNVSSTVRSLYNEGGYDEMIKVLHAFEPNTDRKEGLKDARNMPYRSVYWEEGADSESKFLRQSGYRELAVLGPRWEVIGTDVYGRSPGMDALGDTKQLQEQQKHKAHAIEKMVNPPMVGPSGLEKKASNTLPGGVTFIDVMQGQQGFTPAYQIQPRLAELSQDIMETQQRISRAFYEDLFLMLANSNRRMITAREIEERHEEKLLMLGPVLERLHGELLDPLIDRTFAVANRMGMLPPPPEELQGMDLKVEYISLLAQAQKLVGTASLERFSGFVGNLAAANPQVLDKYDMDQAIDEYANMTGVSPSVVRDDETVAGIRQQREQQQQQMLAAQMAGQAAQGAKTLSETDTGNDTNMLQRILGG